MQETARTAAVQAIEMLKARYFRMMDTKDWDGLRQELAPNLLADFRDATPQHQPEMLFHGRADYLAMLVPMLSVVATVHHGHMPEITVLDPDNATGIWAMEDWVWPQEGSNLPFAWLHGWGHYHEAYRRMDGEWKIASIRLTRLRVEQR